MGLLRVMQLEYLKCFYNKKVAELSKESGDVFRICLASKPTAAEAPEVHRGAGELVIAEFCPTAKSPPWREIQKAKSRVRRVHVPEPQGQYLVEIVKHQIEMVHANIYKGNYLPRMVILMLNF